MKLETRFQVLAPDSLKTHAQTQMQFHLSRFSGVVQKVVLRLTDVNGPKGGLDKRCEIDIRGRGGVELRVEVSATSPHDAVSAAAARAARSLARALDRERTRQRAALHAAQVGRRSGSRSAVGR